MGFLVRLPKDDQRLAICGSTGSGKTIAGLWQLSEADILSRPWFILDFKRDKAIGKLYAKELPVSTTRLPREPGLYVFRPIPERDDLLVKALLWKMWELENCGLYIDEGYMIGRNNSAFNALLTQGRSKRIQIITLSQRPAWMSRFVFSEADYFQVFRLNDQRDYETVQAMCGVDVTGRLPKHYSHWYEVEANEGVILKPVPKPSDIIATINGRLKRRIGIV